MTLSTMTAPTVAAAMKPIPQPIAVDSRAATALERMGREDLAFLAVVRPESNELLGVVLRGALERACEANGHDAETCPLALHLKTDIDCCFEADSVSDALGRLDETIPTAGAAARKARARRSLPVVVVSEQKVPIGVLDR